MSSSAPVTLRLLTPTGETTACCDSVRLTLADDSAGHGGGALGILRGHAHAVMALGDGPLRATLRGETVFSARVRGGVATVKDDVVTVVSEDAEIE